MKGGQKNKNKPLLGLKILRNFTLETNIWTNGLIIIPKIVLKNNV